MRLSDRRALGDLPLQDHRPESEVDVYLRSAVYACRIEARDEFGRYIAQGHQGSTAPVKTIGDVLGASFWGSHLGKRKIGAWSFAMPAILQSASAQGDLNSTALRKAHVLPVYDKSFRQDTRFKKQPVGVHYTAPSLPANTPGIALSATFERGQETVFLPSLINLIAVNHAGDPAISSTVFDLDAGNALNPDYNAKLHTMMRVVRLAGGCAAGANNALAWQLGLGGQDGTFGRGLVIDTPGFASEEDEKDLHWLQYGFEPSPNDKVAQQGDATDDVYASSNSSGVDKTLDTVASVQNMSLPGGWPEVGACPICGEPQDTWHKHRKPDHLEDDDSWSPYPGTRERPETDDEDDTEEDDGKSVSSNPRDSDLDEGESEEVKEEPEDDPANIVACSSSKVSGPLEVGSKGDVHKLGETKEGWPINALHLSTKALFKNKLGDGPLAFESWIPEPEDTYPFRAPVHLRWHPGIAHEWACGSAPGKWVWQAEVPVYIPEEEDDDSWYDPRDPEGDPPKEEPPKSGGVSEGAICTGPTPVSVGGDGPDCTTSPPQSDGDDGTRPSDGDEGSSPTNPWGGPLFPWKTDALQSESPIKDLLDSPGLGLTALKDALDAPSDAPVYPSSAEQSRQHQKDNNPQGKLEESLGLAKGTLTAQVGWGVVRDYIAQGAMTAYGKPIDAVCRVGDTDYQRRVLLGGTTTKVPTFASQVRAAGGVAFRPFATATGQHDLTRGGHIRRVHTDKQAGVPDTACMVGIGVNQTQAWDGFSDDGKPYPGTPRTGEGGVAILPPEYATPDGVQSVLTGNLQPASYAHPWTESTRACKVFIPGGLASLDFAHPSPTGSRAGARVFQSSTGLAIILLDADGNVSSANSLEVTEGAVKINGKLDVSGLIDPTGLVLDKQASNPISGSLHGMWSSDATVSGTVDGAIYWENAGSRQRLDKPLKLVSTPQLSTVDDVSFANSKIAWSQIGLATCAGTGTFEYESSATAGEGLLVGVTGLTGATTVSITLRLYTPEGMSGWNTNGIRLRHKLHSIDSGSVAIALAIKDDNTTLSTTTRSSLTSADGSLQWLTVAGANLTALVAGEYLEVVLSVTPTDDDAIVLHLGKLELCWE